MVTTITFVAQAAPEPADRLAADVLFRELLAARRGERRSTDRAPADRQRHRIVAALSTGGQCEVCGDYRPDPKGICPGAR